MEYNENFINNKEERNLSLHSELNFVSFLRHSYISHIVGVAESIWPWPIWSGQSWDLPWLAPISQHPLYVGGADRNNQGINTPLLYSDMPLEYSLHHNLLLVWYRTGFINLCLLGTPPTLGKILEPRIYSPFLLVEPVDQGLQSNHELDPK